MNDRAWTASCGKLVVGYTACGHTAQRPISGKVAIYRSCKRVAWGRVPRQAVDLTNNAGSFSNP